MAEIIGTFAIVLSLLLVAYELRQNTAANYAASNDALGDAQIEWRSNILSRPELMLAWSEQLEIDVEIGASAFIGEQLLLIYERAYFSHKYERLGLAEWERYKRSMCNPLVKKILPVVVRSNFTEEFWLFLQECTLQEN
ncbi:MAG: hypothetical protein V7708_07600 [Oceanicoccus sp.]